VLRSFAITTLLALVVAALLVAYVLTGHAAEGLANSSPLSVPL